MNQDYYTDFLTPESSFSAGVGSCFNIGGNYFIYNVSKNPQEADERALRSDWGMVGRDLSNVIEETPIEER